MGRKRLTTEEFIRRAREVHGDKYDYSKAQYVGWSVKTTIICPIHGEFLQSPNGHAVRKHGCPYCVFDALKQNQEDFIRRAKEVHGDKYDYSKVKYNNARTKVIITCPVHGDFLQKPYHHLDGHGCTKCCNERLRKGAHKIGIMDEAPCSSRRQAEDTWRGMLRRGYSEECKTKHKTYRECVVCQEWHLFSTFKEWFDKHYVEGWHLDKDILVKENKVYSPETCCFVPSEINALFRCNVKEETIKKKAPLLAEKYKDQLEDRVYEILKSYSKK